MKKNHLSLLFLVLLPTLLFGSVWNSNALGQKLSIKETKENIGWEREEEGDVTTLYYNGKVEKTRTEYPDGYQEWTESESVRFFYNEMGNMTRKIITRGDEREEYNYFYSDSLLTSFSHSIDSVVVEKCEYLRTPEGVVLALVRNGNPVYFSNGRVYEMVEGQLETFSFMEEEESEREWLENGGYSEKRLENGESVVYTYDGNGRLVEKKGNNSIMSFFYDNDGSLIETTEENEKEIIKSNYYKGKVLTVSTYSLSGEIKRVRKSLSDGTYSETRYIDSIPRYVFHIDRDGERILEAKGL